MSARVHLVLGVLCFACAMFQVKTSLAGVCPLSTSSGCNCYKPPYCGSGTCKTCNNDPGDPTNACCCLDSTGTRCKT